MKNILQNCTGQKNKEMVRLLVRRPTKFERLTQLKLENIGLSGRSIERQVQPKCVVQIWPSFQSVDRKTHSVDLQRSNATCFYNGQVGIYSSTTYVYEGQSFAFYSSRTQNHLKSTFSSSSRELKHKYLLHKPNHLCLLNIYCLRCSTLRSFTSL